MEAFRLSREKYAAILSGKGAEIIAPRWKSVGCEQLYLAAHDSVAVA